MRSGTVFGYVGKLHPKLFAYPVLELSTQSAMNCLAPSGFSANCHTTEQFVTCGSAVTPMPFLPNKGGASQILPAVDASSFSAVRNRLIALMAQKVLPDNIARTLPPDSQLS